MLVKVSLYNVNDGEQFDVYFKVYLAIAIIEHNKRIVTLFTLGLSNACPAGDSMAHHAI